MRSFIRTCREPARAVVMVALIAALAMGLHASVAAGNSSKSERQALFIAKIVRFVDWPDGTFASDDAPIRIGIHDDAGFGDTLSGVLSRQEGARAYEVEMLPDLTSVEDVHIVVVTQKGRGAQRKAIGALKDLPVVTFGPSFRFAEFGGTIGMKTHQGKIAFEVNNAAARRTGIRISSRVLKLATTVY